MTAFGLLTEEPAPKKPKKARAGASHRAAAHVAGEDGEVAVAGPRGSGGGQQAGGRADVASVAAAVRGRCGAGKPGATRPRP